MSRNMRLIIYIRNSIHVVQSASFLTLAQSALTNRYVSNTLHLGHCGQSVMFYCIVHMQYIVLFVLSL